MAMTAWAANVSSNFICLSENGRTRPRGCEFSQSNTLSQEWRGQCGSTADPLVVRSIPWELCLRPERAYLQCGLSGGLPLRGQPRTTGQSVVEERRERWARGGDQS